VQYTPSEGLKLVDVSGSGGVSVGGEVLEGSAKFVYSPGQVSFDVQPSSSTKAKLEAVTAGLLNKVSSVVGVELLQQDIGWENVKMPAGMPLPAVLKTLVVDRLKIGLEGSTVTEVVVAVRLTGVAATSQKFADGVELNTLKAVVSVQQPMSPQPVWSVELGGSWRMGATDVEALVSMDGTVTTLKAAASGGGLTLETAVKALNGGKMTLPPAVASFYIKTVELSLLGTAVQRGLLVFGLGDSLVSGRVATVVVTKPLGPNQFW
jgi:hypothetical protein